jgi:hypothetical protein
MAGIGSAPLLIVRSMNQAAKYTPAAVPKRLTLMTLTERPLPPSAHLRDPSRRHAPPEPLFTRWIEAKPYQTAADHLRGGRPVVTVSQVEWGG